MIHGEVGEVTRMRLAGFYRACRKLGLEVPSDYVVESNVLYIIHRVAILIAVAAVFYPGFNPGRITTAINRNVSLFTASISYSAIVSNLERALLRGWVQNTTFILVMVASIVLIVGIIVSCVGGCMSIGNCRMRRYGLYFPLIGGGIMAVGLVCLFLAYSHIVAADNQRVPANFPMGFVLYRYCDGPALAVSNLYPQMFSRAFYDEMSKLQDTPVVNLLRCGWAGSQKYGNVIWSGDVPSTFEAFANQIQCGLNMGLAGIPWWTTDIGGFMTDDVENPDFRQLLIRWYQFDVYSPVLRMHGDRGPYNIPALDDRDWGGGYLHTGQRNELWSYGEENYAIMRKYYDMRISMHDYIRSLFAEAHENGSPLLRAMFYEFPQDGQCWELQDQYMFGAKYLVAPILHLNQFRRAVYLPAGR